MMGEYYQGRISSLEDELEKSREIIYQTFGYIQGGLKRIGNFSLQDVCVKCKMYCRKQCLFTLLRTRLKEIKTRILKWSEPSPLSEILLIFLSFFNNTIESMNCMIGFISVDKFLDHDKILRG